MANKIELNIFIVSPLRSMTERSSANEDSNHLFENVIGLKKIKSETHLFYAVGF